MADGSTGARPDPPPDEQCVATPSLSYGPSSVSRVSITPPCSARVPFTTPGAGAGAATGSPTPFMMQSSPRRSDGDVAGTSLRSASGMGEDAGTHMQVNPFDEAKDIADEPAQARVTATRRWRTAVRTVGAVAALTARERWVKQHGEKANVLMLPLMAKRMKNLTRKAFRQEYKQEFNVAATLLRQNTEVLSGQGSRRGSLTGEVVSARSGRSSRWRDVLRGAGRQAVRPMPLALPSGRGSGVFDESLGSQQMFSSTAVGKSTRSHGPGTARRGTETSVVPPPPPDRTRRRCCGKLCYKLEESFSNSRGKAVWLSVFAACQVFFGAALLLLTQTDAEGGDDVDFAESLWESWTYVADPGTHAEESAWARRAMSFLITVGGMLFFAVVVGFVVDAIRDRMEDMKRGKSSVAERGHYLILGWTDKSFSLIRELCLAMKSEGGGVVVILSARDKEEVEGELKEQFSPKELCGSTVVCRTGSPLLMSDLNKVAASDARAIVILAGPGPPDKADAQVLRTVLGLMGLRRPIRTHVVAELRDIDNEGLVKIIGRGWVETVVSHDMIGRLMIKCARQPGLADAYEMFLGFEGDEFYLSNWPALANVPFGDVGLFFPTAIPVGVKRAETGELLLNPPRDLVLAIDDDVLFLAEDDDTYQPTPLPANVKQTACPAEYQVPVPRPESLLMCGWRRDMDNLVELLNQLVCPGSSVHIISEVPESVRIQRFEDSGLKMESLQNLSVHHHIGNATFRRHLERLPVETFTSVLILADEALEENSMHSDSAALASLLLIRHIQEAKVAASPANPSARSASAWLSPLSVKIGGGSNGSAPSGMAMSRTAMRLIAAARAAKSAGQGGGDGASAGALPSHAEASEAEGSERLGGAGAGDGDGDVDGTSKAPADGSDQRDTPRKHRSASTTLDMLSKAVGGGQHPLQLLGRAMGGSAPDLDSFRLNKSSASTASAAPAPKARRRSRTFQLEDLPALPALRDQGRTSRPPSGNDLARAASLTNQDVDNLSQFNNSLMCCELLDVRTRTVVEENPAIMALSDFILSSVLVSRVLAMVAERREVERVLAELLGPYGQEVMVLPAASLVRDGECLSFWDVQLRAQTVQQILLGYRPQGCPHIITNPRDKASPRVWSTDDKVIVIGLPSTSPAPSE